MHLKSAATACLPFSLYEHSAPGEPYPHRVAAQLWQWYRKLLVCACSKLEYGPEQQRSCGDQNVRPAVSRFAPKASGWSLALPARVLQKQADSAEWFYNPSEMKATINSGAQGETNESA